ncbi:helix-turn-helix domain-containing protein [Nocardia huaxiensis]|uniref:helix-turn-helix domain-containing protein n=1 Tax=Nocardia huaxiensis TaxID=2755382 RepID=UPI001E350BF0|nr:AraC family transcriptional regulator [Nocardia huaxiensis]UFS97571.1 AraC family transcriptional regulator [Nocardia huaxiensis]
MTQEQINALPQTCYPTVWLWPGHALYAGPSLNLGPHSGSVWCFAVGVDRPYTLRVGDADPLTTTTALIPPRTTHQLISDDGRMIFAYLDPTSRRAEACRARMSERAGATGIRHAEADALLALGTELIATGVSPGSDPTSLATGAPVLGDGTGPARATTDSTLADALDRRASTWIELAAPAPQHRMDARITEAAKAIRADPAAPVTAAEFAGRAGLSESRFLHLFRQETGTSLRRYRQWSRLLRAAALTGAGLDLTTAAVEAGFASPSHFADRFRTTFGLSATRLRASGVRTRVLADRRPADPER